MKYSIYFVVSLLLISSCSSKKEKREVDDYGDQQEQQEKVPASVPSEKVEEVQLKNTATFHTILIKQMKFEPAELNLHKGDTVLWINKDITDHDVTEETKKAWTSPKLMIGKSWTKVVKESANYYCSIHVVMKGKLIVE
jgi:plastocyanin